MNRRATIGHAPIELCRRCLTVTLLHARWQCNNCYRLSIADGTIDNYPLMGRGKPIEDEELLWIYNRCKELGRPGNILWQVLGYTHKQRMTGKVCAARKRLKLAQR